MSRVRVGSTVAKVAVVDERNAILANLRTLPTEQRVYLYKVTECTRRPSGHGV